MRKRPATQLRCPLAHGFASVVAPGYRGTRARVRVWRGRSAAVDGRAASPSDEAVRLAADAARWARRSCFSAMTPTRRRCFTSSIRRRICACSVTCRSGPADGRDRGHQLTTPYGAVTHALAGIAAAGVCVVSGMARGIDAAAHRAPGRGVSPWPC